MTKGNTFAHLATAELTDQGMRRSRNEDAIIRLPQSGVFCVADGIGGADGGHEASAVTVTTLLDVFRRADEQGVTQSFEQRKHLVREAMNHACQSIRQYCVERGYRESGTTAVTMVFDMENARQAAVLHAGDSRAYRFREGGLQRLTRDHTLAVEANWPDQNAWVFGMRTIITRAVGVRPFVELDETPVDVLPGDLYILCTDGLTRMLDDHTIAQLLTLHGTGNLNHTVRQLVREANIAGGKDNITILLVRVDDSSSASTRPSVHRRRSLMGWIRHLVAGLVGHPDQPACGPVR